MSERQALTKESLQEKITQASRLIVPADEEYNSDNKWYELEVEGSHIAEEVSGILDDLRESGDNIKATYKSKSGRVNLLLRKANQSEKRTYLKFVADNVAKNW